MVADRPIPPSEAQTAVAAVKALRDLMACPGWPFLMAHLVEQRDTLGGQVLDDDPLDPEEREKRRQRYIVFRDLCDWPQKTLAAQISVLEGHHVNDGGDDIPESEQPV